MLTMADRQVQKSDFCTSRQKKREREREREIRDRDEMKYITLSFRCLSGICNIPGTELAAADTGTSPTSGGSEGHEGSPGMAEQTHKQYFSVMKRG